MSLLYRYILRELLKIFVLATLALTTVITMGGALANVVKGEMLPTSSALALVPMVVPMAVTFAMPIAALFAATMVYGRLAAENELTACRAAGVNVHRLFLPAVVLGLAVSVYWIGAMNYLIPKMFEQVETYARKNIRDLAFQQLRAKGYVRHEPSDGPYRYLTAEAVTDAGPEILRANDLARGDGYSYMVVDGPTFLQLDEQGRVELYITASRGLCQFNTSVDPLELRLFVTRAWITEMGRQAAFVERQEVARFAFPFEVPRRVAFQTLPTLVRWLREPWRQPRVGARVESFRDAWLLHEFASEVERTLSDGNAMRLAGADGKAYEIQATEVDVASGEALLSDVTVTLRRGAGATRSVYTAPRGALALEPVGDKWLAELTLHRDAERAVIETLYRENVQPVPREASSASFAGLTPPADVMATYAQVTPDAVLNRKASFTAPESVAAKRDASWAEAAATQFKILGQIHFRFGMALSTLVTIVLAASLGVIFRGNRALTAFFLACLPIATVFVLLMTGKNLTERPDGHTIGLAFTWGTVAVSAIANLVALRLGVRR